MMDGGEIPEDGGCSARRRRLHLAPSDDPSRATLTQVPFPRTLDDEDEDMLSIVWEPRKG